MRHGQSDLNRAERFSGRAHAVLTLKGKRDSAAIGKVIRKENSRVDGVFASPAFRARETALILCKKLDFDSKKIVFDPALVEQNFGWWEKKPRDEIETRFPGVVGNWRKDHYKVRPLHGENYWEIEKRVRPFVRKLKKSRLETIVVVTHANTMRLLLKCLLGLDREKTNRLKVHNTIFYQITEKNRVFRLKKRLV